MYSLKEFTLREILLRSTAMYAKRPALRLTSGEGMDYARLRARCEAISAFLAGNGVAKGDRVGLVSENCPDWGAAYFAITAMGAVVVPVLTDFKAAQIANIIEHSGCKAVLVSRKLEEKAIDAPIAAPRFRLGDFEALSRTGGGPSRSRLRPPSTTPRWTRARRTTRPSSTPPAQLVIPRAWC